MIFKKLIFCFGFLLSLSFTKAQTFYNLNFEQTSDSSKTGLCYWDLSWGGKTAVKQEVVEGKKYLLIQGNTENSVGFTEQSSPVSSIKGIQIITVSATIHSEDVAGKGAGLNIGLYDSDGSLLANKDMGGFYSIEWIKGTTATRNYSISLVCPQETSKIKIGAILYGKGKAYFSDYKVMFSPVDKRKPNKLAITYVSAACDTIMKHSLVRDSLDIKMLKQTALKIAGPAKQYSDCYLAVNYLLESLRPYGDHHSFFMKADEVKNFEGNGSQVSKISFPSFKIMDECGYILVPPFHGGNKETIRQFADSLQYALAQLNRQNIKGWIIDLRQNTGGNMEPMVAGLGPIFTGEKLGALVNVNGKADGWYYNSGKYYWDSDTSGLQIANPVTISKGKPIAVLIGNQTGSSGEALTLSFVGNARTKLFGQPTWGLTTGNGSFRLPDGARMYLASTIMVDRNGRQYSRNIQPDVLIEKNMVDGKDVVIEAAVEWIRRQY